MRVDIQVYRTDHLTNEHVLLLETQGELEEDCLYYPEDDEATHQVRFEEKRIVVKREAKDGASHLVFIPEEIGSCEVTSSYGVLAFETKLNNCQKEDDRWEIEYEIWAENTCVSHVTMCWKFKSVALS